MPTASASPSYPVMTLDKMLVWRTKLSRFEVQQISEGANGKLGLKWLWAACTTGIMTLLLGLQKNKGKQRHEREDNMGVLRLSVAKGISYEPMWAMDVRNRI